MQAVVPPIQGHILSPLTNPHKKKLLEFFSCRNNSYSLSITKFSAAPKVGYQELKIIIILGRSRLSARLHSESVICKDKIFKMIYCSKGYFFIERCDNHLSPKNTSSHGYLTPNTI